MKTVTKLYFQFVKVFSIYIFSIRKTDRGEKVGVTLAIFNKQQKQNLRFVICYNY